MSAILSAKLFEINARRQQLVATADAQRGVLSQSVEVWRTPLGFADHGITAIRFIKSNPVCLAASGILFTAMPTGRISKWFKRGWLAYQLIKKLRSK